MPGSARIGSLHVLLALDSAAFNRGIGLAQREMAGFARSMEQAGARMRNIGRNMTLAISAPLVGLGVAAVRSAGNFESAMNRVAISTQGTATELAALRDLALDIGRSTVFGASEAAGAMDELAKTGLSAQQILDGAGRAAANLAAATGSELAPAAIAVSDSMRQFGISASQLPMVVNQITGAVNQSRMSFADYQLAIGQAGGAAGGLGVNFQDFNAALAGTSSLFSSGSDAGTSFKTFLQRLVPQSDAATAAIENYSLSFFDAQGNMRSMADIAETLRMNLGGLSDEAKSEVLTTIFGTDAMRTAIGLMNQGAAGIDRIRQAIAATDAAAQSAQRMQGFNAQLEQLGGALENLAIAIGDAGMLQAITGLVRSLTSFVETLSRMSPAVLQAATVFGVVVAAVGPVLIVLGAITTAVGRLAPLWAGLGRIMLPVITTVGSALGTVLMGGISRLLIAVPALAVVFGKLRLAMLFLTGPWGLVIGVIALGIAHLSTRFQIAGQVSEQYRVAQQRLAVAQTEVDRITQALATSTGAAAAAARDAAQAALTNAAANLRNARSALVAAQANLRLALSQQQLTTSSARSLAAAAGGRGVSSDSTIAHGRDQRAANAQADLAQALANGRQAIDQFRQLSAAVTAPLSIPDLPLPDAPPLGADGSGGGSGGGGASGPTQAELAAMREALRLEQAIAVASASGNIEEERALQRQADVRARIEQYEQAGLSNAAARVAAEADIAELTAAQAAAGARAVSEHEETIDLQLAELRGDRASIEYLETARQRRELINYYRERGVELAVAEANAEQDILDIEEARAANRSRMLADQQQDFELELARASGQNTTGMEAEIRARDRARALVEMGVPEAEAIAQAHREGLQLAQATMIGSFRENIHTGLMAAFDGNFGDFLENLWRERVSNALNSVLDMLMPKIAEMFAGGKSGSGGLFGFLNSILGLAPALAGGKGGGIVSGGGWGKAMGLFGDSFMLPGTKQVPTFGVPGFAEGGSGILSGVSGLDANMLQMNGNPIARVSSGELLSITPANDAPRAPSEVHVTVTANEYFDARVASVSGNVVAATAGRITDMAVNKTMAYANTRKWG